MPRSKFPTIVPVPLGPPGTVFPPLKGGHHGHAALTAYIPRYGWRVVVVDLGAKPDGEEEWEEPEETDPEHEAIHPELPHVPRSPEPEHEEGERPPHRPEGPGGRPPPPEPEPEGERPPHRPEGPGGRPPPPVPTPPIATRR